MSSITSDDIIYEEGIFVPPRGIKLFTCRWLPPPSTPLKALVFLCHGYGMECSMYMKDVGVKLAKEGYGVFGIDIEGHGKSEGLRGYIYDFDVVVNDCSSFFKSIWDQEKYRCKPRFLYGESMGGANAILVQWKEPEVWNGAILLAPMVKISNRPPQILIPILKLLAYIAPTWSIVPTQDGIKLAFKDPEKQKELKESPYIYNGKPRVKTALVLLNTSTYIEKRQDEVKLPFLLLQGEDDKEVDPNIAKALYANSKSKNKTFKLYPGMWHGLIYGESKENATMVLNDIVQWINANI